MINYLKSLSQGDSVKISINDNSIEKGKVILVKEDYLIVSILETGINKEHCLCFNKISGEVLYDYLHKSYKIISGVN